MHGKSETYHALSTRLAILLTSRRQEHTYVASGTHHREYRLTKPVGNLSARCYNPQTSKTVADPGVPTVMGNDLKLLCGLEVSHRHSKTRDGHQLASHCVPLVLGSQIKTAGPTVKDDDDIALIKRIHRENPLWSPERIHDQMVALGVVDMPSPNTIAKYIPTIRKPPTEKAQQSWKTFLVSRANPSG